MGEHRWTAWLVLAAALIGSQVAVAVEVEFVFTTTVFGESYGVGPTIPGVLLGDTLTLRVVADNGNDTLVDQEWYPEDVVNVPTVDVGTYHADYFLLNNCTSRCFKTEASSETLIETSFTDTNGGNQDSFGFSSLVKLTTNAIHDSAGRKAFFSTSTDPGKWTATIVPEPSAQLLGASSLAMLALVARLRRSAQRRRRQGVDIGLSPRHAQPQSSLSASDSAS